MKSSLLFILVTGLVTLAAGCGANEADVPAASEPEAPAVEPAATETVSEPTESAVDTPTGEPSGTPAPPPEPEPDAATTPTAAPRSTTEPAPVPAPTAVTNVVGHPTGPIEVGATKEGLTRIGNAKCQVCHKIQHASWAESSHAGLDPVLDCESCHGPGSEYKKMSIMKNREQAIAAGLVLPEAGFCKNCHVDDWDDGMLAAAHDHKPAP